MVTWLHVLSLEIVHHLSLLNHCYKNLQIEREEGEREGMEEKEKERGGKRREETRERRVGKEGIERRPNVLTDSCTQPTHTATLN